LSVPGKVMTTVLLERMKGTIADKTKLMSIGNCDTSQIMSAKNKVRPIAEVDEFCQLGSVITKDSSCDKEIRTTLGKANSGFGRINNILRNRRLKTEVKI